ncbi:putative CAMK family protein kinase [Blattamonas nauphoetae]|uniref:non-specific serine/threonine protein kinase n=1 Tax=Blattamonas nauphoetae TaxID=2049346 RepID=A0ABQ9XAJ8_9EUKA|nr:putative CAMK family protein kinase [Blattamonas nauphoetae]
MNAPPGYGFVRHISDGGFGTVLEVSENSTGEHFAAKMMRSMSEKDKERIGREVHRLRTFVHPGIVGLKELVPMENMEAIVMELGGQSLAQLVKSHSERGVLIDRHIVYQVMVDISSALCFMHNHGTEPTAHGDVKLENILLFRDGHAKLCDLGGAESEDVSSTRGVMSMQYVSPERMDDENGRARASADVWALGIVLHWLLFGKGLFSGQTMVKLVREIGSFKPSQIEMSCGEEERELLMRMLDPDEGSRLTSKQLVESSILRCLINSKEEGWKLIEMKSKEMEKAEKERNELQNELKKLQKEKEECQNELKSKMEEIAAMTHHEQPKVNYVKDEARKGTEQQLEGKQEKTDERVVSIRNGADAIEWFESERWWLVDSVFTCHKPSMTTLLTFSFGKVVARFTFTIQQITAEFKLGIVASSMTDSVKGSSFTGHFGGAGWNVFGDTRAAVQHGCSVTYGSVCARGKEGQRVILEADGRYGKRTLRLSQDGQTQPTFFSHITIPFRFAIIVCGRDDSVQIDSLEELTEPTLTGGTREIKMDD